MKNLDRRLNLLAVVSISISSMLGSGIFVLPGLAIHQSGSSLWLAYFIASIAVLPAAMSKAELATAMPASGGTYVYLERTFGPFAGTFAGIGLWISVLFKSSFALLGIGTYVSVLFHFPIKPLCLSLLVIITFLNVIGIGKVSGAVIAVVVFCILGLLGLIFWGSFSLGFELQTAYPHSDLHGLLAASGLVFVSYAGVTKIAAIAEEIKNPEKNLPLGILLSLGIATLLYCGVSWVLTRTLSFQELDQNLKPIFTYAEKVGGSGFGVFAAILASITMVSMANSGILAASRFPFAMSRDQLLPRFIGKVHTRFLTPTRSILASATFIAFVILFLEVEKIAKLASAFLLVIYILESVAVIILRETRVQWYTPQYRAPLYPYLQIFGVLIGIYLIFNLSGVIPSMFAFVIVPGTLLYLFYSRHRTERMGVIGIRGKRKEIIENTKPIYSTKSFGPDGPVEVVVSLFGKERSPEILAEMATSLIERGSVEVAYLTEVPEQTSLHEISSLTPRIQNVKRRIETMSIETEAKISFDSIFSHDIIKSVHEISRQLHCKWLVKEWGGRTHGALTLHNQMGWLENHLACHLLTYRDMGVRFIKRILVYLNQGPHDDLLIDTADHLGRVHNAHLTFCTFSKETAPLDLKEKGERYLQNLDLKAVLSPHNTLFMKGRDLVSTLVEETSQYDLLVLSANLGSSPWERLFGTPQDRITESANSSVAMIQYSSPQ